MSQATAGVTFDLIWQIDQWRQQMEQFQTDLRQMSEEAQANPIQIPVSIDIAALNAQVDAAIAEIESTRSITIPVNVGGGWLGGAPASLGDSIDEYPPQGSAAANIAGRGIGEAEDTEATRQWYQENQLEIMAAQERLNGPGDGGEEEAGEAEDGAAAGGAAMGGMGMAFGGLFAARHLYNFTKEELNENKKIDFTDNQSAQNEGQNSGVSMGTKEARESLNAYEEQNSGLFGGTGWAIRNLFTGGGEAQNEQDLKDALAGSEQEDAREKRNRQKIEQEKRQDAIESRFSEETTGIREMPASGSESKFDSTRDSVNEKYEKLAQAVEHEYQATEKNAQDQEERAAALSDLTKDRHAALQEITKQEQAEATEKQANDEAEAARLHGDSATAEKAELIGGVTSEYERRRREDGQGAADQWFQKIGKGEIDQGSSEIDENQRFQRERATSGLQGELSEQQARASGDTYGAEKIQNDNQTQQKSLDIQEQINKLVTESGDHRSKSVQDEIDSLEQQLGLVQQIGTARDEEIAKAKSQHEADLDTDIKATEARAHGGDREADLLELENKMKKDVANASPEDQVKARQLGSAQIDQFIHQGSHPFMGSEDAYLNQLQSDVLKGGGAVDAQAKQFQNDLNNPGKEHKEAAEELKNSASALLTAAKAFGGILLMEAAA